MEKVGKLPGQACAAEDFGRGSLLSTEPFSLKWSTGAVGYPRFWETFHKTDGEALVPSSWRSAISVVSFLSSEAAVLEWVVMGLHITVEHIWTASISKGAADMG